MSRGDLQGLVVLSQLRGALSRGTKSTYELTSAPKVVRHLIREFRSLAVHVLPRLQILLSPLEVDPRASKLTFNSSHIDFAKLFVSSSASSTTWLPCQISNGQKERCRSSSQ